MAKLFNRAKMTTSTTGTGTITLGSASNGFQSFADAGVANGDVVQYVIEEGSNFEIGTGTYTSSGTTLSRTPTESSNSDAAITLAGQATVSITAVAADMNRLQHNGSDKVTVSSTGASVTGNLAVTGTVDGVDVGTFKSTYDSHNHDDRYYTETEADNRFVNVTGDTMTAPLTIDTNTSGMLRLSATNSSPWAIDLQRDDATNSRVYNGGGYWQFEHRPRHGSNIIYDQGYHPEADKWTTARTLSLSGDASGSVSWDGSANATLSVTVANNSHTHTPSNISGLIEGTSFSGEYPLLMQIQQSPARIFSENSITFRGSDSRLAIDGNTVWHAGNDGSGSGLDADTVDGQHASALGVPSGVICMWSGTNANIPSGWYLCDGTNGTPDLRDRFIVGSGSSYTTGNTGGAASVTLTTAQMPSHTHSGPSHTHSFSGTTSSSGAHSFAARNSYSGWNGAAAGNGGQRYTLGGPNHTHTFSGTTGSASGTTGSAGSGSSHENRPPYYALAYIMKS